MRKSHSRSHLDAAANSLAGGRYTREPSLRARAASNPLASWDKISEQVDLLADEEFYVIGDRVIVDDRWQASVAYFGETHFGPAGLDWVGVVLDEPAGEHQGKWHGREYFQCAPKHGLFVRPNRLRRLPDSALGSSRNSSRSDGTPTFTSSSSLRPQSATSNGARCPSSSASSLYYYDEDYRPSVGPSAESLARKLQGQQQAATSMQRRPMHGILKPSSADDTSQLGARVTELNKRLEEARSSTRPSSPGELLGSSVFNFRPRRERLSSFDLDGRAKQLVRQRAVSLSPFREPPSKGERVKVRLGGARTGARQRSRLTGVLRFMGETSFATGEWAGVELDEPAGKNDGSVLGQRYFHCANNYGLFVPASRVCKLSDSFSSDEEEQIRANNLSLVDQFDRGLNNFGSMRSTIKSPPPTARVTTSLRNGNLHYSSPSLSRSATPISYESASTSPLSFGSSAYSASPSQHQTPRPLTPSSRPVSASPYASRSYSTLARKYDDYEFDDLHKYDNGLKHHGGTTRENRTHYHDYATSPLAKFDERDIELELRRSLRRPTPVSNSSSFDTTNQRKLTATLSAKPKAVTYTFTSSKYDGNPIARRTLVYE